MLKVITEGELLHIRSVLTDAVDEIEAVKEETDYVFTTGVEDGVEESLEIIDALLKKINEEKEKELDAFFESISTEAVVEEEVV